MKLRTSSRIINSLALSLLVWSRLGSAQTQAVEANSVLGKRYYHHEVHLDENRHNDEFFSFVTRPDLDAPKWNIEIFNKDAITPGYWFSAPYSTVNQAQANAPWNAPHIYDSNGDLIWSGAPSFGGFTTFDFRVINVQGRPMLSVIYPHVGKAIIFDDSYEVFKIIDMGHEALREDEQALNVHEFTTVKNGTKALYLTRLPKRTSRGISKIVDFDGECFAIFDGIRELDTKTWNITNTWNAEGHIGLDESYVTRKPIDERCTQAGAWDYLHANSIDTFANGDYLVSGRRTSTLYRISRSSGSIIWRLGGRKSDFQMSFKFSGQHAARIYEQNDTHTTISLLDNAFLPPGDPQTTNHESRGLLLSLDETKMTAELLAAFPHPEGGFAMSRGNMYMLPNGNAWICWTEGSLQSEHTPDGDLIMKARFKAKISSYRTFKLPWIGRPKYPPDVHAAVVDKNGQSFTIVHVSWNGATEVREWNIYHTNADGQERKLAATIPRRGFETSAWTEGYGAYVVAEALDQHGVPLGVSHVFASLPPRNHTQPIFDSSTGERKESWISALANNAPAVFTFGLFLGGLVASLAFFTLTRYWKTQETCGILWWKRRNVMYEPLNPEQDEEDIKSEAFVDSVEA